VALREANAQYTQCDVDFENKPDWFTKVNPAGKIPAITYGGPVVPPSDPSPESIKLAESLVLLEFIAELYPAAGLMPSDPVQSAQVRLFVSTIDGVLFPAMLAWILGTGAVEGVVSALKAVQAVLEEHGQGPYFLGERFSIADIALVPFYKRLVLITQKRIGADKRGEEHTGVVRRALESSELARLRNYADRLMERPSVGEKFDEVSTNDDGSARMFC
ncbi:glutathione S-transferase C-terminal-like protein, partial [Coniophora puteana RWD-64-598 SS2]